MFREDGGDKCRAGIKPDGDASKQLQQSQTKGVLQMKIFKAGFFLLPAVFIAACDGDGSNGENTKTDDA